MIFVFGNEHGDGIIWFSEHRSAFWNSFFILITKVGEAWTYVLLLVFLLFYRFRYAVLVFALAILVPLVTLTLKGVFAKPRPKQYFTDNGLFDNLNIVENVALHSANSFPSGHTISAFAVLGFAAYAYRQQKWICLILTCLAILVAISRVYLVQHFLVDVCAGALLGSGIAWFVSWISLRMQNMNYTWLNKNLMNYKESLPKA